MTDEQAGEESLEAFIARTARRLATMAELQGVEEGAQYEIRARAADIRRIVARETERKQASEAAEKARQAAAVQAEALLIAMAQREAGAASASPPASKRSSPPPRRARRLSQAALVDEALDAKFPRGLPTDLSEAERDYIIHDYIIKKYGAKMRDGSKREPPGRRTIQRQIALRRKAAAIG